MSKTGTNQRKLPGWMKKKAVGDAIDNICGKNKPANTDNNEDEPATTKRRLRSNYNFPSDENNVQAEEIVIDTSGLPMVTYQGKIHYLIDYFGIAEACDALIKQADEREGDEKIGVAFDMEWTFSFQTGPDKTSLIQLCIDMDDCYLLQLTKLKKLPATLSMFLNHPRVILHGVNIKNDLRKLERDFPLIKSDPLIEKCLDLGVFYNEVYNSSGRWSMERLVLQVCQMRMDKSRQVRMSKWHIVPLSEKQKNYAAIDVYVSNGFFLNPVS